MEAIKKKMQAMKLEKDNAMDQADACEQKVIYFHTYEYNGHISGQPQVFASVFAIFSFSKLCKRT